MSQNIDFEPLRLARRLGSDEIQIERISGGQSNPTYFVSCDGETMVLRKPPLGSKLPSAHAIDREYRVMEALSGTDIPVPRMIMMEDDPGHIGTPFFLMERLNGRVYHDNALHELSTLERSAVYGDAARLLARIHAVDWKSVGLEGFGREESYFRRQVDRWSGQWRLSQTREDKEIEALCIWLSNNVPPEERTTIVHGDYRLGNLLLSPVQPCVVGVLDWELSTLGHPLADLSHFCTCWDLEPDQLGGLNGLSLKILGLPSREDFIHQYMSAGGIKSPLLPFHRAFALFRLAVIFEGIAARHRAGSAAADNASAVGKLSAICALKASEILSKDDA